MAARARGPILFSLCTRISRLKSVNLTPQAVAVQPAGAQLQPLLGRGGGVPVRRARAQGHPAAARGVAGAAAARRAARAAGRPAAALRGRAAGTAARAQRPLYWAHRHSFHYWVLFIVIVVS